MDVDAVLRRSLSLPRGFSPIAFRRAFQYLRTLMFIMIFVVLFLVEFCVHYQIFSNVSKLLSLPLWLVDPVGFSGLMVFFCM